MDPSKRRELSPFHSYRAVVDSADRLQPVFERSVLGPDGTTIIPPGRYFDLAALEGMVEGRYRPDQV